MTTKPTYPNSRPEQAIMLAIALMLAFGCYCAGRASTARDVIEQAIEHRVGGE